MTIRSTFQLGNLQLREVKELAQCHPACEWWHWDLNSGKGSDHLGSGYWGGGVSVGGVVGLLAEGELWGALPCAAQALRGWRQGLSLHVSPHLTEPATCHPSPAEVRGQRPAPET